MSCGRAPRAYGGAGTPLCLMLLLLRCAVVGCCVAGVTASNKPAAAAAASTSHQWHHHHHPPPPPLLHPPLQQLQQQPPAGYPSTRQQQQQQQALSSRGGGSRSLLWYLGDYTTAYIAENEDFIGKNAKLINGVLHCCGGPTVLENGTMAVSAAQHKLYAALTQPEVSKKLSPVMLPISPNPLAVQSGQASKAVPALVELTVQLGYSGFIADYEPHGNLTAAHAQAFATFLTDLASGLHAKDKKLGVCVSDWGVDAPKFYKLLGSSKADLFTSMGSTYYGSDPKDPTRGGAIDKLHVTEMLAAFPLETIAIGIGTMVPGGKCSTTPGLMTGEYGWTQNSLKVFLDWVGSKGITKLGIWRADIAALLYKQPHYCGVEPWMLAEFQAWASNKTVPLSLKTDDIRGSTAMKQQLRHAAAPLDRTVMAWMGWGGRTDAQIDDIVRYFIANRDAITTASPTSHSLGDNATLIERNLSKSSTRTRQDIFKQLRAGGVRVLPTIWNDAGGMKTSLLPKFLQLAAAPDNFIDQAVALAVVEDLDGWNIDFELGAADWDIGDCHSQWKDPRWGPRCEKIEQAGALLATFLEKFAAALHKKGKVLSLDIGTDTNPKCSPFGNRKATINYTNASVSALGGCYNQWWVAHALNATSVDRFISMTTYKGFDSFVIGTAQMLEQYGSGHSAVASPTTGIGFLTGMKYSTIDLQRRFSAIAALDVKELDIWFVDAVHGGVPDNWLPFLRKFVAGTLNEVVQEKATVAATTPMKITTNRTAMAWVGWGGRTDAKMDIIVGWFAARHNLLTASPTSHTLSVNGTLMERPLAKTATYSAASVFKKMRAAGIKVLPTIYNDANGYHTTLLPRFMAMAVAPDSFIEQAVTLAVNLDLEGWNIDFEISAQDMVNQTLVAEAGQLLVKFVDKFATALHVHGKVLSLDVGTYDRAWWEASELNASALDSIADMSTYQNYRRFMISLGMALLDYSPRKIGVGFPNHNFTDIQLVQRFAVIEGLGVHEIDIWFVDDLPKNQLPANWLPPITKFLDWNSTLRNEVDA